MRAFAWVLVCAVCFVYDVGASVPTTSAPKDVLQLANERLPTKNPLIEGRGKKKSMMKTLMAIKMVLVSFLIPKVIALALYASWKGITISLIAFTIAILAALKQVQPAQSGNDKSVQHIYVRKDGENDQHHHEHWWRKIREAEPYYTDDYHHSSGPYHGWED